LPGATSAVMEMCVDNPRQGFGELFDTHPSVERRVAALVKFAGGHDSGPLALPPQPSDTDDQSGAPAPGPWGPAAGESVEPTGDKPVQPWGAPQPNGPAPAAPSEPSAAGPWGPHNGNAP
jgi:heat shock protein HtpX